MSIIPEKKDKYKIKKKIEKHKKKFIKDCINIQVNDIQETENFFPYIKQKLIDTIDKIHDTNGFILFIKKIQGSSPEIDINTLLYTVEN